MTKRFALAFLAGCLATSIAAWFALRHQTVPAPAASPQIIQRNARRVTLTTSGPAALVVFDGRHVTVDGAINAKQPTESSPQVTFRLRYGATITGTCRAYTGPPLALVTQACRAPDGSYWAVQQWNRLQPNYGGNRAAVELHVAHWTGATARLEQLRWDARLATKADPDGIPRLCGRYTYRGHGVYGFKHTRQGKPLDTYERNVYLDALDSDYGPGWRRVNSFLANPPDGHWCYLLWPHESGSGEGASRYRVTALGPGVTPIVRAEIGPPPARVP